MDNSLILPEILNRRSIRHYKNKKIEMEKIEVLTEAARLAPSVCNLQPLRILVVDKPEDMDFMRKAAYSSGAVMTAPVAFIGLVDSSADGDIGQKINELYEAEAIEPVDVNTLRSSKNKPFKLKLGLEISSVSAAIGLEHVVLQAVKLGLGSCWVHHFEFEEVREYFKIPDYMVILAMITLGYPDESPKPRPRIPSIKFTAE